MSLPGWYTVPVHLSSFLTKQLKFWKERQLAYAVPFLHFSPLLQGVLLRDIASLACLQSWHCFRISSWAPNSPSSFTLLYTFSDESHWGENYSVPWVKSSLFAELVLTWISLAGPTTWQHLDHSCDSSAETRQEWQHWLTCSTLAYEKLHPHFQFSWTSPSTAHSHLSQECAAVCISNTSGKHKETMCCGVLCTIQWANVCLASVGLKVLSDSVSSLFKLSIQVLKAFLILLN